VILSSFDPRMLLAARAAGSGYDHALLLAAESPPFLHAGGAQAFDCASVHLDHRLCTPATIRRYHDQGLQVGVWTVNAAARKQTLAGWGVERIITDCP
jgi:glycerophosphoryl diester phosphodiesterase